MIYQKGQAVLAAIMIGQSDTAVVRHEGNVTKIEHIQLKALCFVFNEFTSSYAELLKKSEQPSISIHLIKSLAKEDYKCIIKIAPEYLCTLLAKHNIPYDLEMTVDSHKKCFKQ